MKEMIYRTLERVVCIKILLKTISRISIVIIIAGVLFFHSYPVNAGAELRIIEEPTYTLERELIKGDKVIGWTFEIIVKIQNSGNIGSQETIVNLSDEEGITLDQKVTIDAGETKDVDFTWSTIYSKDQELIVHYFPSNLDTELTEYNSGSTRFTIVVGDNDQISAADTPGFEILLILVSLLFIIILKKQKNRF